MISWFRTPRTYRPCTLLLLLALWMLSISAACGLLLLHTPAAPPSVPRRFSPPTP